MRTEEGRGDDPLIGRVLDGRYRVDSKVARGGMATVYLAHDLRLDRPVAVKVMHAGMGDDPEFVARFEREARSAARLSHHNVVSVFDQGDDAGTLFLVMEYVPGLTLRDEIRKDSPMDPGKALALIEPVLAALAAAHDAGMIHRDVKPENVLIARDGRVKVADFGLARAVNAETQHTATGGVLIGTVSYLSPELVVDGKADARSDVYAVGVIIYEMLTGQKPHQADSPIQVAYKHVHEDVPAPSRRVPGIPGYVDALVARATARDKDLRPSDARVLLHQVRRVRQALDHGVTDDPDLVADLMPSASRSEPTDDLMLPRAVLPADEVYDVDVDLTTPIHPEVPARPAVRRPPPTPPAPPAPPAPRADARPLAAEPPRAYPPQRRSRRGLFLLIGLLLVALLVGLGAWQLGRYTTTPSVIGLSKDAARTKIEKAGLELELGKPVYSDKYSKDAVVRTDPAQGDRITKGGTVTVVLSLGPDLHAVPTVKGKTLEQVQALIEDANLTLGTVTQRYSESVESGRVITTDPVPGTQLRRDAAVDVVLSKGRKPIGVPDYTGKPAKAARKALTKLGFTVTLTQEYSDTVPLGTVIAQDPRSGTGFKGDQVRLVVSKGPELIEIPKVKGKDVEEATDILREAGFLVAVQRSSFWVGADIVVDSDPKQGDRAPRGTTVTLTVV